MLEHYAHIKAEHNHVDEISTCSNFLNFCQQTLGECRQDGNDKFNQTYFQNSLSFSPNLCVAFMKQKHSNTILKNCLIFSCKCAHVIPKNVHKQVSMSLFPSLVLFRILRNKIYTGSSKRHLYTFSPIIFKSRRIQLKQLTFIGVFIKYFYEKSVFFHCGRNCKFTEHYI